MKYVFVPGCTLSAYSPEKMEKILIHLRDSLDGEVAAVLRCCGKVTKMLGEEEKFKEYFSLAKEAIDMTEADVIITICPNCYNIYKEFSGKKVISYWELMQQQIGLPESAKGIGKQCELKFNIHDPCSLKNEPGHHEAIRWMMNEMDYQVEEIEYSKSNTRCCGVGGMACTANPELYNKFIARRAADFKLDQVVTYCGSCRGSMEAAGKDALHILDLMFADKFYDKAERTIRAAEDIWAGRMKCKEVFERYN